MKPTFRPARILLFCATMMFAAIPGTALAHDNLGGDELSMSGAMLIGAIVVTAMALIAGLWAWRSGQFTNTEESKYNMLDTAENYDEVMAEADRQEAARKANSRPGKKPGHKVPSIPPDNSANPAGRADNPARA